MTKYNNVSELIPMAVQINEMVLASIKNNLTPVEVANLMYESGSAVHPGSCDCQVEIMAVMLVELVARARKAVSAGLVPMGSDITGPGAYI